MENGSKSGFVFDKNLSLMQTQTISGGLANLFANRKPKPEPIPKVKKIRPSGHGEQPRSPPSHDRVHFQPLFHPQPPLASQHHLQPRPPWNPAYVHGPNPNALTDPVPQPRLIGNDTQVPSDNSQDAFQIALSGAHEDEGHIVENSASDVMDISSGSDVDENEDGVIEGKVVGRSFLFKANGGQLDGSASSSSEGHNLSDDAMDLSSGSEVDGDVELEADEALARDEENEESDDPDQPQSTSNTESKGSRPSSHTSLGVSGEVHSSVEENGGMFGILKPPSRASSSSLQLFPAKVNTPDGVRVPPVTPKPKNKGGRPPKAPKEQKNQFGNLKPRTTIPPHITPRALAQQGIHAAYSSRLNPFALHPEEYRMLRDHICHLHISAYLNIRNRILRLWVRNPLVAVTAEEAAGSAMSSRWLGLAEVAFEWLVRKGYINFGCVEIPEGMTDKRRSHKLKKQKKKTIVVVGAGMAGLGCARQLEGLFRHYHHRWSAVGDEPPHVILLEGRNRIGGRVYSHPLKAQSSIHIPSGNRCTAEMGAHIVVGFDHGNPLSILVRGQMALPYYALKNDSIIHDTDGDIVNEQRDGRVEALFNDVLDRASVYRHRIPQPLTVEGDKQLIEAGKDPQREGGPPISVVEQETPNKFPNLGNEEMENVPGGIDKLTGKAHMIYGSRKKEPPALTAEAMGWKLGSNVPAYSDLNLDVVAKASKSPALGAAMDEAVKQYQFLLDLSAEDMRLLNWHYANLEYANAANVGKLSLGGWDQDTGNEFEGTHAQLIGGYQQVPRGILHCPSKLDLHTRKIVNKITYNMWSGSAATAVAKVQCEDGEVLDADHVVLTSPLGVLKDDQIKFDPPLPEWKKGPIRRLGFGLLNKIVLVYDEPFWPTDQDMFGLLREPEVKDSLDQEDYIANRGRFYFFWNCIKTSGRPVLISLMAGDAAYEAETRADEDLISEVTNELSKIFKRTKIPSPQESLVTRWGGDRFARGTYSYVGATSVPGDYEAMAAPYGNLHFAGEATCATHPATVHGAYISGLRAASEVIDDLLGPIDIPKPLVPWPTKDDHQLMTDSPQKRKAGPSPKSVERSSNLGQQDRKPEEPKAYESQDLDRARRLEAIESDILSTIYAELGLRPSPPQSTRPNAFLLYTSEKWAECKATCEEARRAASSEGTAFVKAGKNEIRQKLGHAWNALTDEEKKPYIELAQRNKMANLENAMTFDARLAAWDSRAMEIRREYVDNHPDVMTKEEETNMWKSLGVYGDFFNAGDRKAKRASGYADAKPDDA